MEHTVASTIVPELWMDSLTALGDRQRCRIISLLSRGELCVHELTVRLGLRQNTASHHLKVLRDQGFILARRCDEDQRWIYYRLNPDRLQDLARLFLQMYEDTQTALYTT